MAYLGVVEAVLARLQGKPKTFVPSLPALPEHSNGGSASVASRLTPKAELNIGSISVPIYHFDPSGRDNRELWPCLTFDIMGITPRVNGEAVYNSQAYKGDYAYEAIEHSKVSITDVDENGEREVRKEPTLYRERPVMRPYDFLIEIQALADDDIVSALLVEHVYANVFDPHDAFLRVPMRDGTYRSWDVIFKGFQDLDMRRAVRAGSPGIERQYAKSWTYVVEGYLDNTDLTELVNAARSRKLSTTSL